MFLGSLLVLQGSEDGGSGSSFLRCGPSSRIVLFHAALWNPAAEEISRMKPECQHLGIL